MPSMHRSASMLAVATGLGVLISAGVAAPASAADPFTPDELSYNYPSNAAYDYVPILDAFSALVTDRPDIIALNDSTTVDINVNATPEQVERAIVDQYADMSVSMADGLGQNLSAIYQDAMAGGDLPKTQSLLTKSGGLVGYYSSSNPSKNYFDYDRPYIRFADSLVYRDKEGGDAWASTSGAYPSGHTSQAYWQGTTLATLLPELAPQILARTSEAGHNRIVMGAHYPLDVIGGRMMGQHIVERRWSDPEFRVLFEAASAELHTVLEEGCGDTLANCIAADVPYLSDDEALAVYAERMSYDFPQIGEAGQPVTVPANAESLLISSHPDLTDAQRRQVLELTVADSGYPLDKGTEGSWQRLNLAAAMDAEVSINADGSVSLIDGSTPEPDADSQELQVTIPQATPGEFVWNIDGTNGLVDMGTAIKSGDHYAAVGSLNPIRVTDTRPGAPEWSVSAQVSDFASADTSFSATFLGWTPSVVLSGGDAVAGTQVDSGFLGGEGLSTSATLGYASLGHALGSATLGAGLDLKIPVDVSDGTYTATITLTALS
ncbi:phosphatase PAP2 family protein [Sanguibacter sp. 25GB23B1]|uniref:acid phosphatase n=1 Tax=unclassified Sanguibacter TaxID=2645534 RepID=UPI0032AEEE92